MGFTAEGVGVCRKGCLQIQPAGDLLKRGASQRTKAGNCLMERYPVSIGDLEKTG